MLPSLERCHAVDFVVFIGGKDEDEIDFGVFENVCGVIRAFGDVVASRAVIYTLLRDIADCCDLVKMVKQLQSW